MLFRSTHRPRIRNEDDWDAGFNSLIEWFGLTDDMDIRAKRSLKEATVYICIKILSEALGKLPIKSYQDVDDNYSRPPSMLTLKP